MNYWEECIAVAFDEAGIIATKEQISGVVGCVEGAHENYGMAHGHDCIPNPLHADIERLKRQITEKEKNHDRQISGIIKGVAQRRNVDMTAVNIDADGNVTYDVR